jgi:chitinase
MSIDGTHPLYHSYGHSGIANNGTTVHRFGKRVTPWGPPFHIPLQDLLCPSPEGSPDNEGSACLELSHVVDGSSSLAKRASGDVTLNHLSARGLDRKTQDLCDKLDGKMIIVSADFHTSGTVLNVSHLTCLEKTGLYRLCFLGEF